MRRVKIEIKLLIGSQVVNMFSTEANCTSYLDTHPLFATINKEVNKWKKSISMLKEQIK